jgi:hypothetical protein
MMIDNMRRPHPAMLFEHSGPHGFPDIMAQQGRKVHLPTVVFDRLRVRIDKNVRVAVLLPLFHFWRREVEH